MNAIAIIQIAPRDKLPYSRSTDIKKVWKIHICKKGLVKVSLFINISQSYNEYTIFRHQSIRKHVTQSYNKVILSYFNINNILKGLNVTYV